MNLNPILIPIHAYITTHVSKNTYALFAKKQE